MLANRMQTDLTALALSAAAANQGGSGNALTVGNHCWVSCARPRPLAAS